MDKNRITKKELLNASCDSQKRGYHATIEKHWPEDKEFLSLVEKIAAAQLTDKERIAKSDYLLYNDEEQLLVPEILSLHKTLIKLN